MLHSLISPKQHTTQVQFLFVFRTPGDSEVACPNYRNLNVLGLNKINCVFTSNLQLYQTYDTKFNRQDFTAGTMDIMQRLSNWAS